MAYAAYTDVQAEFRQLTLTTTSTPTQAQVTEWLAQIEGEINSRVGMKYVTPVTSTEGVKILKRISIMMAAGRTKEVLRVKQATANAGDSDTREGDLEKRGREMLKEIVMGTLPLPGATLLSTDGDGVASSNVSAGREHVFSMDDDQW